MLLATIEIKSQVGSFGNNVNNRAEEALGNATDLWTAYREGTFGKASRPWLGYFMLLEEAPESTQPVKTGAPHFAVRPEFKGSSYAKRYELLCQKLVLERLYHAACFMLSDRTGGVQGKFTEPASDLSFQAFAASLIGHATEYRLRRGKV